MTKTNKTFATIAGAAVLSLIVSGCSGGNAGSNASETGQKDTEKEKPAAVTVSNEPVTIKFAYPFNWVLDSEFKQYIVRSRSRRSIRTFHLK